MPLVEVGSEEMQIDKTFLPQAQDATSCLHSIRENKVALPFWLMNMEGALKLKERNKLQGILI